MQRSEISATLAQSVQYVLEMMCFAEATPVPGLSHGSSKRARIPFRGSLSGKLELDVSTSAVPALTSAFLGLQPSEIPSDRDAHDLICELGTVVCGRFLSALDCGATLEIGEAQLCDLPSGAPASSELQQCFQLDCGHLAVSVQLD
jgi:hypothetical protein